MNIMPASPNDLSRIKALLTDCELPSNDLSDSHLKYFFIIKDAGRIAGSVGFEICGEYGLLRSLALRISLRGRGIGAKLVKHIEGQARSHQIKALYLLTTSAERFFLHNGYQTIPRERAPAKLQETTEFQNICPVSATCMLKEL